MREMKYSGNIMIGDIPQDWNIVKLKMITSFNGGYAFDSNQYVEKNEGVRILRISDFDEKGFKYGSEVYYEYNDKLKQFLLSTNDIIMCMTGGTVGKSFFVDQLPEQMLINQRVADIKATNAFSKFVYYCLQTPYVKTIIDSAKNSTNDNISKQTLDNLVIAQPPIDKQQQIADYLDEKCAEIDSIIAGKENENKSLEEYRKAVIYEAVTKGLNPNTKMKDSGIDWIGQISNNAYTIRLKLCSYMKGRIGWQGLKASDFIKDGPYCITGTDFYNGKVNWNTCYHVSEERYEMDSNIQVQVGDLLITKDGTIGKLAIIDYLPNKACLNSHLLIIRPLDNVFTNKFLYYVMKSPIFANYYSLVSIGTIMDSISQEKMGEFAIPVFNINEQKDITDYLDKKCEEIDNLVKANNELISNLKDYKKSLIYEAVTGKIEIE